ncbi:hypothetical protein Patl1_06405 [Pistacia atlantica]|nr:hypothetical protein Patl1_06405 [Pistacia atlantica]
MPEQKSYFSLLVYSMVVLDCFSTCRIYVEDFLLLGMDNGTAELHPRKYSVTQADGTYRGEIQVGLTLTRKFLLIEQFEQTTESSYGGWKESDV